MITACLNVMWVSVYSVHRYVVSSISNLVAAILGNTEALFGQMIARDEQDAIKHDVPMYSVPNPVKPSTVDESFIRCYGRLGHLGDNEWRTEADHRVHRERNHDGTVFSSSDVDVRREDRKQLEEDPMAKREDSILLFGKH